MKLVEEREANTATIQLTHYRKLDLSPHANMSPTSANTSERLPE